MLHFFYEIADNDFKGCLLEQTRFPNLKRVKTEISFLMMNFHFYIFEAVRNL